MMTQNEYAPLYQNGIIAPWYLRDSQLELYKLLKTKKRVVCNCHRRFGKGTTILTYVFERAATEKLIIRYGGPTQKQAYDILGTLIDHIYEACPGQKPRLLGGAYVWPSGSVMHVFGVKDEGELDKARGTEADIIICDEYGFWRHKPAYVLRSVLSPQVDETDGQIIIASTPPEDLTQPFVTEELPAAELSGNLFRWDIDDSLAIGDMPAEKHQKIISRCDGIDTDAYKREYKLDLVANRSRLVVPEAQLEENYVGTIARPPYFSWFAMCDLGLKDFFHMLWGYVDFRSARLIVEREFCANYMSTGEIAHNCREVEIALACGQPLAIRRLGDSNDPQQLYDLCKDHDYAVSPIVKRSKMNNQGFLESCINGLRVAIGGGRILINKDHCPILCIQLKYGIWNERRTDFERTEKLGHLDGLMALAYMFDNADFTENPYPVLPEGVSAETHFINPEILKMRGDLKSLVGSF